MSLYRYANEGITNVGVAEAFGFGQFQIEIEKLTIGPVLLVEIDFPSGTVYLSGTSVRFSSQHYPGKVINVGTFRRAIQKNLGLFETSSIEVSFADTDGTLIDLAQSDQIKGVMARFKLGAKSLPLESYQTIFEGFIDDFGTQNFMFTVTVKDKMWTMPEVPDTGTVTASDFPFALPTDVGRPIPVCYGSHSFTEDDDPAAPATSDARLRGAWPTLYVDVQSSARTFLIAGHAVKAINEVYAYKPSAGSQLLVLTTDYLAFPAGTLNGETMAYIQLTSDGFDKLIDTNALGVLTVNVDGKEDVGDGTGTLIDDPILVLQDFLALYLGDPEINQDLFDAAYATTLERSYTCLGGYTEEKQTQDFIREICDSFNIRIFPDRNGKIGVSIFDTPDTSDLTSIRDQWEILKNTWQINYNSDVQGAEDSQIINNIDYSFKFHWASKIFRGGGARVETSSEAIYGTKKLSLKLPWSDSALTASDVAGRITSLYKEPVANFKCEVPLLGMAVELGDIVKVTHPSAPGGGFSDRNMEITEIIFNPNEYTVSLRGKDIVTLERGADFYLDDEDERTRVEDGTCAVTNSSNVVTFSGATSMITAGVQVDDVFSIPSPASETNRINVKVTEVTDATHIKVNNTTWSTASGMSYKIKPSWITAGLQQKRRGHLCDESTGEFSNGDEGFRLL